MWVRFFESSSFAELEKEINNYLDNGWGEPFTTDDIHDIKYQIFQIGEDTVYSAMIIRK